MKPSNYRGPWGLFVGSQFSEALRHFRAGMSGAWFIIGGGLRPGATLLPAWRRWLRLGRGRR